MNSKREIDKLARGIQRCQKCERSKTRQHSVPGSGDPNSSILLFGEAPGKKEDKTGQPFVGRAGRYLEKVLVDLGVEREELFITSILKCYHPGPPRKEHIAACRHWSVQQFNIIKPRVILIMGKTAASAFWEIDKLGLDPMNEMWQEIPCIITCHPAAAMRFPERDKQFQRDFGRLLTSL